MDKSKKLTNLRRNLEKNRDYPSPVTEEKQSSRWQHFYEKAKLIGEFFVACKNIILDLTVVLLATITIILLFKTVFSRTVSVKPVPVPKALVSHGFTEKVFATRIAAKLLEINRVAVAQPRRGPKLPEVLLEDRPDIQIPGEAVSFQTIVGYFKDVFGSQDIQVYVDVTEDEKDLAAQIRVIGGSPHAGQASASAPISANADELIQQIAFETMRLFSPELLASYKLSSAISKCHGSKVCDTTEALNLFNDLISKSEIGDPTYMWALASQARTLQEMGRDDDAKESAQRILDINKNDEDAILVFANALAHQNQTQEATAKYLEILKLNPRSAAANINLGILYKKQCRLDDAIKQYEQAIKYNPRSVGAHYNRAIALYAKAKTGEKALCSGSSSVAMADQDKEKLRKGAIDEYKTALEIDPTYVSAYQNLGDIYQDMNKSGKAMEQYQSAINIDPGYARPYKNIADIWLAKGKSEEAATMLKKAVGLDPNYAEARESLAKVYEKQGDADEAKKNQEYATMLKTKSQRGLESDK